MQDFEELSPRQLAALKQIRLTGRILDRAFADELLSNDLIVQTEDGALHLTRKGRSLLIRGSEMLWDLAS
jgi:hypothetical protein